MKEIIPRKLTVEEKEFIRKYGGWDYYDSFLPSWERLTDSQKRDYQEIESLYATFVKIYKDNYADLVYYALMYRNVSLSNCDIDALSVLYFASKESEIIGYKRKLSRKKTPKAQIVRFYAKEKFRFPQVCLKYAGVNIQTTRTIPEGCELSIESLNLLKTNIILKVSCIDDLTEEQCASILKNCCNLEEIYKELQLEKNRELKKKERLIPRTTDVLNVISCYVSKKTKKEVVSFSPRQLMKRWCCLFEKQWRIEEDVKRKAAEELVRRETEKRKIEEDRRRREEEARLEKFRYNKRNRHSRDYYITFDEAKHTYTVDGKILQSVTNIVENCFPKFDAELHAKYTAAKMGITPEKVSMMWEQKGKESRELGTAMHQKIESYYQGKDSREDDSYRLFKMFAEKNELVPYRTEWAVYDTDHNIAGTIDFVDYQNGEYTIYDWKRSDKIIANGMPVKVSKYQEKGLYPLEHLENCAYYHYALQLSLYKFILERNYNMKISKLRLGIFHPTYDKPYVLEVPYLENEVNTLMGLRSEVIF